MGIGVVNEIVEFLVVIAGIENNVGDYINNSTYLLINTFGSILAIGYIFIRRKLG